MGNGSDELLALATRAFVEPANGAKKPGSKATVQFFTPSYSLYPVLADIQGALGCAVPLGKDFALPSPRDLKRGGQWDFSAALTFVTTPNAPSGRGYSTSELEELCRAQKGVIVLDEAYVDFARENAFALALKFPHVIVARTFSKAYSLCFQRIGYFAGHPALIGALQKIRDSYNVNGLGQIAALTTLSDLPHYRANFRRIIATRQRLTRELEKLGFEVLPSQTNFILCATRLKFTAEVFRYANGAKNACSSAGSIIQPRKIMCASPSEPMRRSTPSCGAARQNHRALILHQIRRRLRYLGI